jgi:hypothetical protein
VFELDHILWAAADLDAATAAFRDASGVTPVRGGSHAGFGTRNSLASLGSGTYFEIIALDPEQKASAERATEIAAISRPRLLTFAVRGVALEAFAATAAELGLEPTEPVAMTRKRADGVVLSWRCVYPRNAEFHNSVPFLIDWEQSEHPSRTTPTGCTLKQFNALHPQPDKLRRIYERLSIGVPVLRAPVAGFQAVLSTPNGDVVLT